jgi:hypothetical protein
MAARLTPGVFCLHSFSRLRWGNELTNRSSASSRIAHTKSAKTVRCIAQTFFRLFGSRLWRFNLGAPKAATNCHRKYPPFERTRFVDAASDRQGVGQIKQQRERPARQTQGPNMFRKLTIAVVAAVSFSAALAPSIASAKGGGFGGGHHHFGGGGFRGGVVDVVDVDAVETTVVDESCYVQQRVVTPWGFRIRTINICAD